MRRRLKIFVALWGLVVLVLVAGGWGEGWVGKKSETAGWLANNWTSSAVSRGYREVNLFFAMDTTLTTGHILAEYDSAWANADWRIQLGTQDTSFCYVTIDSTHPTAPVEWVTNVQNHYRTDILTGTSGGYVWDITEDPDARISLMRVDWLKFIPAGSHIVSAKWHMRSWSWWAEDRRDTVSATLMTIPADDKWWKYKRVCDNNTGEWDANWDASTDRAAYMSHATWSYQRSFLAGGQRCYPLVEEQHPWVPALSNRPKYYDWGDYSDWTGFEDDDYQQPYSGHVAIDMTNCVQAAVNGAVNNGIMFQYRDYATSDVYYNWSSWEPRLGHASNFEIYVPWIEVKYITRPYVSPMPDGKEMAFVWQTDDGQPDFNQRLNEVFGDHGGKYTIFTTRADVAQNMEQLIGWLDNGNELAPHSRYHLSTGGLTHWTVEQAGSFHTGNFDTSIAAWDSLLYDATPEYFYTYAEEYDGDDRRAHPLFAKTFALPLNQWDPYVILGLKTLGYDAIRVGSEATLTGAYPEMLGTIATFRPAETDTAHTTSQRLYERRPRNMTLFSQSTAGMGVSNIVGDTAARPTREQVAANAKHYVHQLRAQRRFVWAKMEHDFKGKNYASGIQPIELDWWLSAMENNMPPPLSAVGDTSVDFFNYMTMGEVVRWFKQNAIAIDTPDGWVPTDSFQYSSHDEDWYLPDGIDNAFIPGIKDPNTQTDYDRTPPNPPSGLTVTQAIEAVVLNWTAPLLKKAVPDKEAITYNVYRSFTSGGDTTGTGLAYNHGARAYGDAAVINGSPHYYTVRAVDQAGNISEPSAEVAITPKTVLEMPNPSYMFVHYKDYPGGELSDATLDSLAQFDVVLMSGIAMNDGESFGDNFTSRIREFNDDIVVLMYAGVQGPRSDWAAVGGAHQRIWDYCVNATWDPPGVGGEMDSAGFAHNMQDYVVANTVFPVTRLVNFMYPALADTIAEMYVNGYINATGYSGDYTGFMLDFLDSDLANWICPTGCDSHVDADNDGVAYGTDSTGNGNNVAEDAAYDDYVLDLMTALRREFAEAGLENQLIMVNGGAARARDDIAALADGYYLERLTDLATYTALGFPTYPNEWINVAGDAADLVNTQTDPPAVYWEALGDSSIQQMSLSMAMTFGGWAGANQGRYPGSVRSEQQYTWAAHGTKAINPWGKYAITNDGQVRPRTPDRLTDPGELISYDFGDAVMDSEDGNVDTLYSYFDNYTTRLILGPWNNARYYIWPYVVYTNDFKVIHSRSAYWQTTKELGGSDDVGAPPAPVLVSAAPGDDQVALNWIAGLDFVPAGEWNDAQHTFDIFGYEVSRASTPTCNYPTGFTVLDTHTTYISSSKRDTIPTWIDTTAGNGDGPFHYVVRAIDWVGNVSDESDCLSASPVDTIPPAAPEMVGAYGGDDKIIVNWDRVAALDLEEFHVYRELAGETIDYTSLIDSVAVSGYNDVTALSGVGYDYAVKAVDDDDNKSAFSGTATGAWFGAIGTGQPPALVTATADLPSSGNTTINVWASTTAADTVGLWYWRVFRGHTADTTDGTWYARAKIAHYTPRDSIWTDTTAGTSPESTFYYSVKGAYTSVDSLFWSPFYEPIVSAQAGGFTVTTPTLQAAGDGSGIVLTWNAVAGADSVRIFRSVTEGSTADEHLTTVIITASPWTDDQSPLEYTPYYYTIRQVDND